MTALKTTKPARGADLLTFPMGFVDESGTGAGPFDPTHASVNAQGALINPATDEAVQATNAALATLHADLTSENSALGTQADAPWNGSGSGSIVAALKAIWARLGAGLGFAASGVAALSGTFSATGQSSVFRPLAGRAFNISLWGAFSASVQLERSFDNGSTWLPITAAGAQLFAWSAAASEQAQEDETAVQYRLNCTSFTSGPINYRVSQ